MTSHQQPCIPKGQPHKKNQPQAWRIIGVGNDFRGDDAFGFAVIDQLRTMTVEFDQRQLFKARPDINVLLEHYQRSEKLLIVDALCSDRHTSGTRLTFDLTKDSPINDAMRCSTHLVSIQESVSLARVLGSLPRTLQVIGIVSTHFGLGEPMSPEAKAQVLPTCVAIKALMKIENT